MTTPHDRTRRRLAQGMVIGSEGSSGSDCWLGIPYAEPPVGDLRWRAPRPPRPWSGLRKAVLPPPVCSQLRVPGRSGMSDHDYWGQEDGLYLNIWSPPFSATAIPGPHERRPVLVWIHGGGNWMGSGHQIDAGRLATSQDVIVVSINYRLGPLGFFMHPALFDADSTPEDRSGNFGLLDQIRALEWVRDNIAGFGGDPGRVTLFGESMGGWNILALLTSPRAAGLFHRAISQSGGRQTYSICEAVNHVDDSEPGHAKSASELLLQLLMDDGTAKDRAGAKAVVAAMSAVRIAAYLRSKSYPQLFRAYLRANDTSAVLPTLFRDGTVLPLEDWAMALRRGSNPSVPVILGSNRDEDRLTLVADSAFGELIGGSSFRVKDPAYFDMAAAYLSLLWKADAVDEIARDLTLMDKGPVYAYRFDWDEDSGFNWLDGQPLGAAHMTEIAAVFGSSYRLFPEGDVRFPSREIASYRALSDALMSYWGEFARTGDPGCGGANLPRWTAWSEDSCDSPKYIIFDSPADGGIRMSNRAVDKAAILIQMIKDRRLERDSALPSLYERLRRYMILVVGRSNYLP